MIKAQTIVNQPLTEECFYCKKEALYYYRCKSPNEFDGKYHFYKFCEACNNQYPKNELKHSFNNYVFLTKEQYIKYKMFE